MTKYIVYFTDNKTKRREYKEYSDVNHAVYWAMENRHLDTEVERVEHKETIIWSYKDE